MQTNLKRCFRYQGRGTLWQVLPFGNSEGYVVEERHAEEGVQYSLLDETGRPRWQVRPWPDRWWTILAAATSGHILIREYADQQSPERQHLHALDAKHGEHEWTVDNFSLFAAPDTHAYGYLSTEIRESSAQIELKSGTISAVDSLPEDENKNNWRQSPFLFREEDAGFATVATYIGKHQTGAQPVLGAEYWESDLGIGISWYQRTDADRLTNWFWWLNAQGERKLTVKLGEGLDGIGQDTFWLSNNHLFFIQNKQDLVGYAL